MDASDSAGTPAEEEGAQKELSPLSIKAQKELPLATFKPTGTMARFSSQWIRYLEQPSTMMLHL